MIEWIALVIGCLALGLNVLFVRKIGKVIQATDAATVAFNEIKKDAQESKKILMEARYWVDKSKADADKKHGV